MNITTTLRRIFNRPAARAFNDAGERIESMRFSVPALRVGVLEYAAGQLETGNPELKGKTVRLYYPPEEVSGKKFLKSLETAPVIVGVGHSTTTSEKNKAIDGWASSVRYDDEQQAAIIDGVVKGKDEVDYIKNNVNTENFGASAFVDIMGLEVKSGVTPDGQAYDAIAKELHATHVALTENVRDPENKIKVKNAVVINSKGICESKNNSEVKNSMEISKEEISAIVKNAVDEAVTAKNESDRTSRLEATIASLQNAIEDMKEEKEEAKNKAKNKEEEEKEEVKNEDEEKKEEEKKGETVENAKPSQALIASVATALNIDFGRSTPSFAQIAKLMGIDEADPFARIVAVNAKFASMPAAAANATASSSKVEVF